MGVRMVLAVVAAGLISATAAAQERTSARLLALTPESVATSATVKDDSLEIDATITTEPADPARRGLFAVRWDDTFLRAFVGKTTGRARYQVYQRLVYRASTYRDFTSVNYETLTGDGPASADLIEIARGKDRKSTGIIGGSIDHEDVAFWVDESLLRKIAARYQADGAGEPNAWRFRFKSRAGIDADAFLMPAEVAGALLAVDRYRKDHRLPTSAAASP